MLFDLNFDKKKNLIQHKNVYKSYETLNIFNLSTNFYDL